METTQSRYTEKPKIQDKDVWIMISHYLVIHKHVLYYTQVRHGIPR